MAVCTQAELCEFASAFEHILSRVCTIMYCPPLTALALVAVRDCILEGQGPQSLASLPSEYALWLFTELADRLCTTSAPRTAHEDPAKTIQPSTPPELVYLFYGSRLERARVCGASDDLAASAFGGGLTHLRALELPAARITAFGAAHVACSFATQMERVTITSSLQLGVAGVAELCKIRSLQLLRLRECGLALDESSASPLLELPALTELDLGGNPIDAAAALLLCADRSERPLRALSLWGSRFGDDAAVAAMGLGKLRALDVSWTAVSSEGVQAIALGLGEHLTALRIGNTTAIEARDAATWRLPVSVAFDMGLILPSPCHPATDAGRRRRELLTCARRSLECLARRA